MEHGSFFEALSDDLVCLVLQKTLKPRLPPIDSVTLASFACVSKRYAALVKDMGWERLCRKAVPDFCEVLVTAGKKSPGGAGWASFAKLLTMCPGYNMKRVMLTHVQRIPPDRPTFNSRAWRERRVLDTYRVAIGSHTGDSWHYSTTLEASSKEGRDVLPGLIRSNGSRVLLIATCDTGPSHKSAPVIASKWTSRIEAAWGRQWNEAPFEGEEFNARSAVVIIYRGTVVSAGPLIFPAAHHETQNIFEDAKSALTAGGTERERAQVAPLSVKDCPFCLKPMERIPESLYSVDFKQEDCAVAEFHVCEAGHVYGAILHELSSDSGEESENEDDFEEDEREEDDSEGHGYSDEEEEDEEEDYDEEEENDHWG